MKKLTQPRDRGVLGFIDCKAHAQALLSKWVSKVLTKPIIEWVHLFLVLFEDFILEQCQTINQAGYTPLEKLLLNLVGTCRSMMYMAGIWKAWAALKSHLVLTPLGNALPTHYRVEDILNSLPPFSYM